jgi:RNA polymerase sigma-70 factor (ECF subfamily)
MPSLQCSEIPTEVLNRARLGDVAAHECIYRALSKPVYTRIRRLVIRADPAEELLQDTFVEIFCSVQNFRASGSFVGWVRSIAVSKALMYLRSPWHRRLKWPGSDASRFPNGAFSYDEPVATSVEPFDSALERALAKLPTVGRTVVWLHDVEELTHAEISQLLGRNISYSKAQLARAHQQLREYLEHESGGLACTPIS